VGPELLGLELVDDTGGALGLGVLTGELEPPAEA